MIDPITLFAVAAAAILGLAIAAAAALKGWEGWLELRRTELGQARGSRAAPQRIEIADLRDRVRRLEAIANGSDS